MATASQRAEFYRVYGPIVERQCRGTGLYPEVILAQLALESDYGVSPTAHGNLGGRKVSERQKRNGIEGETYEIKQAFENFTTKEAADAYAKQQKDLGYKVYSNKKEGNRYVVRVDQPFEMSGDGSPEDNVRGQIAFLQRNRRYTRYGVFNAKSPEEQAKAIKKAGYATEPAYAEAIIQVYSQDEFPKFEVSQQEYEAYYEGAESVVVDGDNVVATFPDGQVITDPKSTVDKNIRAQQNIEAQGGVVGVRDDAPTAETNVEETNVEEIFTEDDLVEIDEEEEVRDELPQPPMIGPDGEELQPPTADEMDEAQRIEDERIEEEERLRREQEREEEERQINKRANDAKEYQELLRRKRQLNAAYPEDMPPPFARELRNNDERIAEIENEYNLTPMPSDEDFEERRLEVINNIMSDDDLEDDQATDDQITNELLTDAEVDELQIGEEEEEEDDIPNVVDNVVDQNTDQPGNNSFQGLSFNGLGDVADVISQGLGIVDSVRNSIRTKDDLMLAAVGKRAFAESMKEIKPLEVPELSNMFKSHLEQTRQMSELGFSVEESKKARAEIDSAYSKGIENAVRGTAGDRAKFLAMSGVLDSRRQSALLDFAAKDAQLQRQNQAAYTKALSFAEEYNMNKAKVEQTARLQTELQNKKGASDFARQVFQSLDMRAADRALAPYQQYFMSKLTRDSGNPYISLK